MNPTPIRFGTDGWRAVIADGYTMANLERVGHATASWILDMGLEAASVVLGHDTRFMGRTFAERTACVLASHGIRVILASGPTATPAISWATRTYGGAAGVVITASHNPPEYSGFKIKGSFGGSALPAMIADVEKRIPDEPAIGLPAFAGLLEKGRVEERDVTQAYVDHVREHIDIDAIHRSGIRVVHDAMYGAGQGLISRILGADRVVELRSSLNPGFGGAAPEPIEKNLTCVPGVIADSNCDAAIANDGDADRIGMFDDRGRYVDSHRLLALLVDYMHRDRGLSGKVVKTFSTTDMLDAMCAKMGLPLETTPIGFKYIGEKILSGNVLVGGEESGGMAVKGHIPERDGIYIGMLILEMMARRGRRLSSLVDDLFESYGPHAYYREDVHTTLEKKDRVLTVLADEGGLIRIAGSQVTSIETLDGFKHRVADGWVLVRPSGTEPVLRIYAEAPDAARAQALVTDALNQLGIAG